MKSWQKKPFGNPHCLGTRCATIAATQNEILQRLFFQGRGQSLTPLCDLVSPLYCMFFNIYCMSFKLSNAHDYESSLRKKLRNCKRNKGKNDAFESV